MSALGGDAGGVYHEHGPAYEKYACAMNAFIESPSLSLMGELMRARIEHHRSLLQEDIESKKSTVAALEYYKITNTLRSIDEAFTRYYGEKYDPSGYVMTDKPGYTEIVLLNTCLKGLENVCTTVKEYLDNTLDDIPFSSKEELVEIAMKRVRVFIGGELTSIAANAHIHSVDTRR